MAERSWFFAANGQQQGPYPEAQFRDFLARGLIRPDTLVWSEGMAGWQKAGDIPGMMSAAAGPPAMPRSGGPLMRGGQAGGAVAFDGGLWPLLGRTFLYVIGLLLIVPAPWTATGLYRWFISHVEVPGRPNLEFTGKPLDLWYVFIVLGLCTYAGAARSSLVSLAVIVLNGFLAWLVLRWIASNLSSNGQKLPISFTGSALGYLGWFILLYISMITIVGWAWVTTAWIRWICRNLSGTQREVIFNGTGLEVLWRTLVFVFGCAFLIPIPWVLAWYTRWYISQFELAEHGAYANV